MPEVCKRHSYVWLPAKVFEIRDHLYMVDLGLCSKCGKATSRVQVASPGDIVNAMLWGEQRFEVKRVKDA